MHEAAPMQQKIGLDQEALNDAGLIALLCQTEEEIEDHGESNQLNLLLRDFARELLKNRLLAGVSQVSAKSGRMLWRIKKIAVAFRIYHGSVERRDCAESFR
jgi:hypothetical protein